MKKKIFIIIGMLLFFSLVFHLPGICGEKKKGHLGKKILLYLPNRILDLLEVVRLGVHVGPGIGLDLRITKLVQLAADTSANVGVAWQGRDKLPLVGQIYHTTAIGPVRVGAGVGLRYKHTLSEISITANIGLAGLFVAYDSVELLDFLFGWTTYDLKKDDWGRKKKKKRTSDK